MLIASRLPPVVERELRVAARKPVTYWGRAAAGAAGVVIIAFIMFAQMTTMPLPTVGKMTFRLLGGLTAITVLASVVQLASEAFAREKREDTLGLLFLTPLRPVDMVLGKLVSTSLSAFYRFLAVVPVLAVPMLAGGVSVGDFVLLVLALVNLVFLGASVGLWVSAHCWDEKRAGSWASAIIIALIALPAAVALGIAAARNQSGTFALAAFSPGFAVWQAVMPSAGHTLALSASLVWTQLLGWLFFYAACRTLPRCWQKRPESLAPMGDHLQSPKLNPVPTPVSAGTNAPLQTKRARRLIRRDFSFEERSSLLDGNPLAWFALRWKPHASGTWAIAAAAVMAYWPAILAGFTTEGWEVLLSPGYALGVVFVVNLAIKTFAAHQASFTFARDRGEDTLELLLSTPVATRQLIDGHAHALRAILAPVVRRALYLETAVLVILIGRHLALHREDGILYLPGAAAMLALLIPDVRALAWTSAWQSVIKKNAREAQQEAFSRLFVLPWLFVALASVLGLIFGGETGGKLTLILSWVGTSLFVDNFYAAQARHELQSRLTLWAVRRSAGEFEHYDGWKNLGRKLGRWWATR